MELVLKEIKDNILYITLNRPEAHNALNAEIISGLTKIFTGLKKDLALSAVVLKANGPSFCAGGDLNWMRQSLKFTLAQNLKDTQKLSDMYEAIFQCPLPVLAHVQGNIMGGGVGLVAVCDIVAANDGAKFCLSEVKLGLVPSIISPYVLKKVPESEARPLMLTAEIFSSAHAQKINLVHHSGSSESCTDYVNKKLALILNNGPEATRITKALITQVKALSWEKARALTVKTIAKRRTSKEGQEGMNAFFEKRSPTWRKGKS